MRRFICFAAILVLAFAIGACTDKKQPPPDSIADDIVAEAAPEADHESAPQTAVSSNDLKGFWHGAPDFSAGLGAGYQFFSGGGPYYFYNGAGNQYEGGWELSGDSPNKLTLTEEYLNNGSLDQPSVHNFDIEFLAADPATGNPSLLIGGQKFWKMNKPDDIINGFPVYMNLDDNFIIKDYQNRKAIWQGSEGGERIIIYADIDLYDFKISSITFDEDFNFHFDDIIFKIDMLPTGYYVEYVTATPETMPFEAISFAVGSCNTDQYYVPYCDDCYGTVYSYLLSYNGKDGSTCVYAGEVMGLENSLVYSEQYPSASVCLINNAELTFEATDYRYDIFIKYQNSSEPLMVCSYEESAGRVGISPDKARFAYIAPLEFEELGSVYIFDVAAKLKVMAQIEGAEENFTPLRLKWLSNDYLLIIFGYVYGTVTQGGDVYYYHIPSGASGKIIGRNDMNVQVETIEIDGDDIVLGMCLIFNNAMNHLRYNRKAPVDGLIDLIKNHQIFIVADSIEY